MADDPKAPTEHIDFQDVDRLAAARQLTEDEFLRVEKSLKRKLDLRLLMCVWLIFVMNYLDRVSGTSALVLDNASRDSKTLRNCIFPCLLTVLC